MSNISRPLYFSSIFVGSMVATVGFYIFPPFVGGAARPMATFIPSLVCYALLLYANTVQLIFYYKMWKVLPPSLARTTPAKAVGYSLIPIFQFYWIFKALWGWTKDFNKLRSEHNINARRAPEKLALLVSCLYSIGFLWGFFLGFLGKVREASLFGLVHVIIFSFLIWKMITAVNSIPKEIVDGAYAERDALESTKGPIATKQGLGITSLILGILSIISPYLGLMFGIVGMLFARAQRKRGRSKFASAGRICSIVGISIWGLALIVAAIVVIVVYLKQGSV